MGLPVLLAVLQEDRDDVELLKGALEVLQLAVALPGGPSSTGQLQHREVPNSKTLQFYLQFDFSSAGKLLAIALSSRALFRLIGTAHECTSGS